MTPLTWTRDRPDPKTIIDAYATMLTGIADVEAWAKVETGRIHFFTVLNENFQAEPAVYQAEREMLSRFGPELLTFDVYPDFGPLKYPLEGELHPVRRA